MSSSHLWRRRSYHSSGSTPGQGNITLLCFSFCQLPVCTLSVFQLSMPAAQPPLFSVRHCCVSKLQASETTKAWPHPDPLREGLAVLLLVGLSQKIVLVLNSGFQVFRKSWQAASARVCCLSQHLCFCTVNRAAHWCSHVPLSM